MRYLSFFINKILLGEQLCVGTCLKCITVATPLEYGMRYEKTSYLPDESKSTEDEVRGR